MVVVVVVVLVQEGQVGGIRLRWVGCRGMVEVVRGAGVLRRGEVGGRSYSGAGAGAGAIQAAPKDCETAGMALTGQEGPCACYSASTSIRCAISTSLLLEPLLY